MSRSNGLRGKRRGVYRRSDGHKPPTVDGDWSDEDHETYRQLIADSPLASAIAKSGHARRAVEADRQCRALDGRVRTSDEERAFAGAQSSYRKACEALRVTDKLLEDDETLI